jgi:hypothetical protein
MKVTNDVSETPKREGIEFLTRHLVNPIIEAAVNRPRAPWL